MSDRHEMEERDPAPDRTLRALADKKSERVLLDVATWLEMRVDAHCSPSLCRLIAIHYDLLAEHREVVSRAEMVAQYRRRAAHWRMRAAAYGRYLRTATGILGEQAIAKYKDKRLQEDLI